MSRLDRGITSPTGTDVVGVVAQERSLQPVESTTTFFREPSSIMTVVEGLGPRFGPQVAVASVGCSTGEEVYSLLLQARLSGWGDNFTVDGYDYEKNRVERGMAGIYGRELWHEDGYMGEVIKKMVEEGVIPSVQSDFEVPLEIKRRATFSLLDITQGPLPKRYPIIMCANVLYHYLHPRRGRTAFGGSVLSNLADSLNPGGFLVLEDMGDFLRAMGAMEYGSETVSNTPLRLCSDLGVPMNNNGSVERAQVFQRVV